MFCKTSLFFSQCLCKHHLLALHEPLALRVILWARQACVPDVFTAFVLSSECTHMCSLMNLFFSSLNREEGVSLDQKEHKEQKERRGNR